MQHIIKIRLPFSEISDQYLLQEIEITWVYIIIQDYYTVFARV
jgi:hypothetical protein